MGSKSSTETRPDFEEYIEYVTQMLDKGVPDEILLNVFNNLNYNELKAMLDVLENPHKYMLKHKPYIKYANHVRNLMNDEQVLKNRIISEYGYEYINFENRPVDLTYREQFIHMHSAQEYKPNVVDKVLATVLKISGHTQLFKHIVASRNQPQTILELINKKSLNNYDSLEHFLGQKSTPDIVDLVALENRDNFITLVNLGIYPSNNPNLTPRYEGDEYIRNHMIAYGLVSLSDFDEDLKSEESSSLI